MQGQRSSLKAARVGETLNGSVDVAVNELQHVEETPIVVAEAHLDHSLHRAPHQCLRALLCENNKQKPVNHCDRHRLH